MVGIVILILFIIAGVLTGLNVEIPYSYSNYIAVAILACLDSVFGAFAANIQKKFDMKLFLSGFFGNSLIAAFLVFIGQKLNVDIYLAVVIVFSGRLLNNFATIRRNFTNKIDEKAVEKTNEFKTKVKNTKKVKKVKATKKTGISTKKVESNGDVQE